ncbi:hypothetical protein AU184_07860 [Mycolicibacterium novocastrense]|uniref:DUF7159 family protein n=1 Tax=Mycolicibacterium novocastrense TaxID=59813 RepID=UPI00074959A1|nr:hypothetical protein [Mycolicibacterium novocastrense]KUH75096.1 hypothetical protein AU072_07520 [Mycolicibacterium novocastrense]KUH77167.1 hypothetical protein AU183_09290 [Mycolicibacterium novocastrense]KUH77478.1 hypothetical protein AU184_07860 [Mycolicibacterium novocastrense]
MDAVLGLSVTPSAVGLVLVEGQGADGATVDREAIEILPTRRSSPRHASDEAAAAVLRAEALAAGHGHRLHTIGVTWSDDAQTEASLLLRSLRECGFDNVVAVQLPEASEALAWGVAELLGNEVTAVCVIEYDAVIALVVNTREGAVQTAVNHSVDSEDSLIRWLNAVFARADWRPEALVLVGSGADLDTIMPRLETVLSVPVFAPAEAELALARGAALAAADSGTSVFATEEALDRAGEQRRRQPAHAGPLAMLAAGTVTFVVSVSAAISMQLTPGKDTTPSEPTPAAKSSPDIAAAPAPLPAASPPPAAPPPPPPAEIPVPPEAPPVAVVDIPAVAQDPLPAAPPPDAPVTVPGAPALPPESMAPGLVPAQPTPVPERRGWLQRIRDRFSDAGDNAPPVQQAPPPVDPALAPPPGAPLPPPPPEAVVAPPPEGVAPPPEGGAPPAPEPAPLPPA